MNSRFATVFSIRGFVGFLINFKINYSLYSSNAVPIILFFIPDGHTKETAITAQSIKNSKDDGVKKETKVASEETSKKKVDKQKNKKVVSTTCFL